MEAPKYIKALTLIVLHSIINHLAAKL